ncbi:hypothetical protein ACSLBF_15865 [Pseudoalteromonas sp. T1lg65]|uniref:hypothetical protein n=1 Tax=Pseudoalteromonas sp. T1lg65 TaxID=2077101 RepID=UPI003F7A72B7
MKKFFLFVAIVVAFFTIDHPWVKTPRDKLLGESIDALSESSKVQRNTTARYARTNIAKAIEMDADQQTYLNEALSSDDKTRLFHLRYCKERDTNLYFYSDQMTKICEVLEQTINSTKRL